MFQNITIKSIVLILSITLSFSCAKESSDTSTKSNYITINLDTINPGEIEKIDDYPLYYMDFASDYDFGRYLASAPQLISIPIDVFPEETNKWACTCFSANYSVDSVLFGRSFDFFHKSCMLLHTTPPGAFSSYSMVDLFYCGFSGDVSYQELLDNPSKLAKAPFRPLDGVNEKGVAIGLMAVPYAEPPYDPAKASFYDLALIRLVLDYAENTDSAISLLQRYNYDAGDPPVHFLIADKYGNSVIVEYLDNDMKITRNTEPFLISTNFIVYNSGAPQNVSCDRYKKAYSTIKENSGIISKMESMKLLEDVSQAITMWSMVYDLNSYNSISVSVGRNFKKVYTFKKTGG
jgi:hypothetical protein